MTVRVPATSANLGPGFDALALAVSTHVTIGVVGEDAPTARARECDDRHPSQLAFIRAGGKGRVWIEHSLPMGRGLGFSGAARVGGIVAAENQRDGRWSQQTSEAMVIGTELEGHPDNVAASLVGGIVATAAGRVVRVPCPLTPAMVLWVPSYTTSTSESRASLATEVSFADAVFNIGRTALLIAALAAGEIDALRDATADRLHQDVRLRRIEPSQRALEAGLAAGAWCGWLSGSGPTIALMCDPDRAAAIGAALPEEGRALKLNLDLEGARLV